MPTLDCLNENSVRSKEKDKCYPLNTEIFKISTRSG